MGGRSSGITPPGTRGKRTKNGDERRKSFVHEVTSHLTYFKKLASSEKMELRRQYTYKSGFCHICQKQLQHMYLHWIERHAYFKDVIQCLEPSCSKILNYRKSDLFRHMQTIHHWSRVKSVAVFAKQGHPFPIPRQLWLKYKQLQRLFIARDINKSVAHNHSDGEKVVALSTATAESANDASRSIPSTKTPQEIGQYEPESSSEDSVAGNFLAEESVACSSQHAGSTCPSLDVQSNPNCGEVQPNCGEVQPNCGEVQPNCGEVQPNCVEAQCSVEKAQPNTGESPLCSESELASGQSSSTLAELQPVNWEDRSVCDEIECIQGGTSNSVDLHMKFGMCHLVNRELELQKHCAFIKSIATNHVVCDWERATEVDIHRAISAMRANLHQMEAILYTWKEKINMTKQHLLWAQNLLAKRLAEDSWNEVK